MASFIEQETIDKSLLVTLIRCEGVDGQFYYFYIAIKPKMLKRLRQNGAQGDLRIQDYGKVLAWGTGEPPPEVQQRMTDEFGFNHQHMITL